MLGLLKKGNSTMQYSELLMNTKIISVAGVEYPGSEVALVRAIQKSRREEPCFMTGERLLCKNMDCEWREDCRKLIAVWRR